jgi:hypothetical protein
MLNRPKPTHDAKIWEFNYKPDRYIDKSWLETIPNGKLLEKLRNNNRETSQLSHYLLSQLGFNGQFYFDFSDPISRIALSTPQDLKRLVSYIGITYHKEQICKAITKKQIVELQKIIGSDVYQFGLKWGSIINQKDITQVPFPANYELKKKILISGIICLHSSFQHQPMALRKRLLIKLPKPWVDLGASYLSSQKMKYLPENESIYLTYKVAETAGIIKNAPNTPNKEG